MFTIMQSIHWRLVTADGAASKYTHTGTCKPIHSDERLWNVRTKYRLVRPMEKKEQQTHGRRVEIFNRTRSSFSIFALANAFLIRFRRGN